MTLTIDTAAHIHDYTARNGVAIAVTRRVDIGPALLVDGTEISPQDVLALREYFAQDDSPRSRDRCLCGVYRYVHDQAGRVDHPFRWARGVRRWLLDHDPIAHVRGWIWLNLWDDRRRMNAADRFYAKHLNLCWCSMVDAALLDMKKDDFRKPWGCGCVVPMLHQTRAPQNCYCAPTTSSVVRQEGDRG